MLLKVSYNCNITRIIHTVNITQTEF